MNSALNKNGLRLWGKSFNRQMFNPTVIKHRRFDYHIATAKQCGTHWIKYMLSLILCDIYDLPPPSHVIEDNILGHPKNPPQYDHIPQIAVTHSHPHYLIHLPNAINYFDLPKFLIMVRDPRDILVSAYEKSKGHDFYKKANLKPDYSFSEFLRLDMNVKKPTADIWGAIQFMNGWSPVIKRNNDKTMILRYEDLKADTFSNMKNICRFLGIHQATDTIIQKSIDSSSREKMRKKLNPNEDNADKSVNLKTRNFKEWYNDDDKKFVDAIFARYLKDDFGYNLTNWDNK